jgi:glycosyltransferase involved in cell wall biosynthesis
MRILQLAKQVPYPPNNGGRIRTLGLATALASFAEVDLLCFGENINDGLVADRGPYRTIEQLIPSRSFGRVRLVTVNVIRGVPLRSTPHFTRTLRNRLIQLLTTRHYDGIQAEELSMMSAVLRTTHNLPPIVYSAHNVESDLAKHLWSKSPITPLEIFLTKREEWSAIRRSHCCISVSEADRDRLQQLSSYPRDHIQVLPNCPSPDIQSQPPSGSREVLLFGCYGWAPNSNGAQWFIDTMLGALRDRVPDVRVRFVGSRIPERLIQRLHSLGCDAVEDVSSLNPFLRTARVVVVPLRQGSGTRIKIADAWQAGVPVVSTTLGAEGLNALSNTDLLLADSPTDIVTAIAYVLQDDEAYHRLRTAGLRRAANLSWSDFGPVLGDIYNSSKRADTQVLY